MPPRNPNPALARVVRACFVALIAALAVALAIGAGACTTGSSQRPGGDLDASIDADDTDPPDRDGPDAPDGPDGTPAGPDARVDAPVKPGDPDPSHGPSDHLYIDKSIHPTQVWNEPFDFRMSNYPRSWAIAVVHASMLLRSRCIELSPDAVMSIALKESKLACLTAGSQSIPDGCFQIESTSAYNQLRDVYGARFAAEHSATISGEHFETSAIAMAYYMVFSSAMLRKYTACPRKFFDDHPDPRTEQKVLCGAYNRGLWWQSLTTMFTACANSDVLGCFNHDIAADHASAIVDYAIGFEKTASFDAALGWDDLSGYWQRIKPLYADADETKVLAAMRRAYDGARGGAATISFHGHVRVVLAALIAALPPFPTLAQAVSKICTLGYMSGSACQASACADACKARDP